jgi:hypothetical protein
VAVFGALKPSYKDSKVFTRYNLAMLAVLSRIPHTRACVLVKQAMQKYAESITTQIPLNIQVKLTNLALLYIFLHLHDPTTLNRQGNDSGTQYRSIILYEKGNH